MAQTLTIDDDGRTLRVAVGAPLLLRLPENPSTGYRWSVDADPRFVAVAEGPFIQLAQAPGGGGERHWWITTRQAGRTTLSLRCGRSWESEQAAIQRYAVTLQILPSPP